MYITIYISIYTYINIESRSPAEANFGICHSNKKDDEFISAIITR